MISIFSVRHAINGPEQLAPLLRHDDELCRNADDLAHDIILDRCGVWKNGMERRDDWHGEPAQQCHDVAAGFAAEYPEFMLQGNDVVVSIIQERGRPDIFIDRVIVNLNLDDCRIVVGPGLRPSWRRCRFPMRDWPVRSRGEDRT